MEIFLSILFIIALALVILFVFNFVNKRWLSKLKVNKWIVLGAAIVCFFAPYLLIGVFGQWIGIVSQIIFVFLLLWFMELMGWVKKYDAPSTTGTGGIKRIEHKTNKKDVIKPKAKPNRKK